MPLALDRPPPGAATAGEREARHHGDLAPTVPDEILGELGEELAGRAFIRPVGTIEEADFHIGAARHTSSPSFLMRRINAPPSLSNSSGVKQTTSSAELNF